jgi:peptidylprolyl isomerase
MADGIKYRNDKQKSLILDELASAGMSEADLAEMIVNGKVEYGKNNMLTEKSRKQIKALIKQALGGIKAAKAKKPAAKAKKPAAKGSSTLDAAIKDPENTILIELKGGTVIVELLFDIAPGHCARMKELARGGEYDNVAFHRVIDGFMAQTGDVKNGDMEDDFNLRMAGTGGSDLPDLMAEFSGIPHDRGTLAAARSQNPNSANSQFFFNFGDNHFLNRQYTVYGRVLKGMDHVDAIVRGEPPTSPDRMISVKVAADV